MKELIKKVLKSNRLGKLIYEPLHKLYRLYSVPHRRRLLKRHGVEVLSDLAEIFKRRNIPAYAVYGTLLGFVRDGKFMPHDDDIDIGVLPGKGWDAKRLVKVFLEEEKDFTFMRALMYDGYVDEVTLIHKNLTVDFFFYRDDGINFYQYCYYYQPGDNYPNDKANSVYKLPQLRHADIKLMDVMGVKFPVPMKDEEECEDHYGVNWRVPDPTYDGEFNPKFTRMPGFGYSAGLDEVLTI